MWIVAAIAVLAFTVATLAFTVTMISNRRLTALVERMVAQQEREKAKERMGELLGLPRGAAHGARPHHPKPRMGFTPDRSVEPERALSR